MVSLHLRIVLFCVPLICGSSDAAGCSRGGCHAQIRGWDAHCSLRTLKVVRLLLRHKVLLLASSHDAEDGEHSGLERLSSELVSYIGHFLLHGRTDLSGYEVVGGTYALPWEERPEYDEVMATYGHGM